MPDANGNPLPDRGGQPPAPGWQETFLEALAATSLVGEACNIAGISRSYACKQRRNDSEFDEKWTEVLDRSTDALEAVAVKRAAEGSDQLMIFLLKARRPEVYRENINVNHSGEIAGTLTVQLDGNQPIQMDSSKRREAARLLLNKGDDDIEVEARDVA